MNFKLKMTELLRVIQFSKKNGEPKYSAEDTEGGYTTYVTIPIDGNAATAEVHQIKKLHCRRQLKIVQGRRSTPALPLQGRTRKVVREVHGN